MDIHEYQAKALLAQYGVPIPDGAVAYTAAEAQAVAERLTGALAVKAQILAGARGPAGGVRICHTAADVRETAARMLGSMLETAQTGAGGAAVHRVYVERAVEPARELYLALVVDRAAGRVAVLASARGGSAIEDGSRQRPIEQVTVDPNLGLTGEQIARLMQALDLSPPHHDAASTTIRAAYDAFVDLDASLIEINPLVITRADQLLALDAKMSFDDNALFRQKRIADLRDSDDPGAMQRTRHGFNYLKLDGNIGCMVNGAGLAMASLDMIHHEGGKPANFLDVPPSASREQITAAFQTVISDADVTAILINIVGGGVTRCDVVAEAVAAAVKASGRTIPLVVRFEGTNRDLGRICLKDRQVEFIAADNLADAVKRVVALA